MKIFAQLERKRKRRNSRLSRMKEGGNEEGNRGQIDVEVPEDGERPWRNDSICGSRTAE